MSTLLEQLIDDLTAEHAALATVLATLTPEDWDRPTHATGWAVRDQVAHLAHFDDIAARIITTGQPVLGRGGESAQEPSFLERGRAMTPEQLHTWWRNASRELDTVARTADPKQRLPWIRDMSPASFLTARLMEAWSHGLDVVDVVPAGRPDDDRIRHIAQLGVSTRANSYRARGREMPETPVFVELALPSGAEWTWGDPAAVDRISGVATDFCRVVTQRRHIADTGLIVRGDAANEWMLIAQAFAGPPGEGRRPGQFPQER